MVDILAYLLVIGITIHIGIFVSDRKLARVQLMYKCENYCPISIPLVVSKIFEEEIFKQRYDYLSEIRPRHSTLSLLLQNLARK